MKRVPNGPTLLPLLLVACGADPPSAPDDPCSASAPSEQPDSTIVISSSQAPACLVEFLPVVSLAGELDTVAPRPPIVRGPEGTYLSGTYAPGTIALWAPDGSLVRTIGNGPGQGPGEFDSALGIAVLHDSLVVVTTGMPRLHLFTIDGEFVETILSGTTGGVREVAATGSGALFGASVDNTFGIFFRWDEGVIEKIQIPDPQRSPVLWAHASDAVWYAWPLEYEVHRLDHMGALLRENAWIDPGDPTRGNLFSLSVDEGGLLWVGASVPDPNAPGPLPPMANSIAEIEEQQRTHLDIVVEAFSLDGRLIVSERFDHYGLIPQPMRGGGWFRLSDDPLPVLTIVKPVLNPRASR